MCKTLPKEHFLNRNDKLKKVRNAVVKSLQYPIPTKDPS